MNDVLKLGGLTALVMLSPVSAQWQSRTTIAKDPAGFLRADGLLVYKASYLAVSGVQTGLVVSGSVASWSDVQGKHYVVCGVASNQSGRVEHWVAPNGEEPMFRSSIDTGAVRPSAVEFKPDTQRLYVLDYSGQALLWKSWDGVLGLPDGPWHSVAFTTAVPELSNAEAYYLSVHPTAAGTSLTMSPLLVQTRVPRFARLSEHVWFDDASSPVAVSRSSHVLPTVGSWLELLPPGFVEDATSVDVHIYDPNGDTVEVVDVNSGAVLGAISSPVPGPASIALTQGLVIGDHYLLRSLGENVPGANAQECVARYGFAETTTAGTRIGRIQLSPDLVVGDAENPKYRLFFDMQFPEGGATEFVLPLAIGIGFRDPTTGLDPVLLLPPSSPVGPDNYLLDTTLYLPMTKSVEAPSDVVLVSDELDVPQDPATIGWVILHQAVGFVDNQYILSDVLGTLVKVDVGDTQQAVGSVVFSSASSIQEPSENATTSSFGAGCVVLPGLGPGVMASRSGAAVIDRLSGSEPDTR